MSFPNGATSLPLSQKTNGNNGYNHTTATATTATIMPATTTIMSNAALESKATQLKAQSQQLSAVLTQKLASSQSGQNLLHLGTSLSTLPPDLHNILLHLHPVLSATEQYEKQQGTVVHRLVDMVQSIREWHYRQRSAHDCAELYQDLVAAELTVRRDWNWRRYGTTTTTSRRHPPESSQQQQQQDDEDDDDDDELDHAASLERAAHVTLVLTEELEQALAMNHHQSSFLSSNNNNNTGEREQFVTKLAPRIRRLESDVTSALQYRMELTLQQQQQQTTTMTNDSTPQQQQQLRLIIILGHCMRGLAIVGQSSQVESIFANTAIMPIVRSKLSMGRLDQGGARGECAGLRDLLQEMVSEIAQTYSPVLQLAESMFAVTTAAVAVTSTDNGNCGSSSSNTSEEHKMTMDVDLLTEGVWVPIATALMADVGIKMAIFSPGIASILQANYTALDSFLAALASRLLLLDERVAMAQDDSSQTSLFVSQKYYQAIVTRQQIQQAQDRIYAHPKTAEFSKKWNLPIYYQLRFGECCTRMNKAIDQTKREGWIANVYSGPSEEQAEKLRQATGFELSLFIELYDVLLNLWLPDVILRPLTNRFLRGSVQLVGRVVSFISEGMEGKILFGGEEPKEEEEKSSRADDTEAENGGSHQPPPPPPPSYPTRKPYCWGESEEDVAAVAWELTILDSTIRHDYTTVICDAISNNNSVDSSESEQAELRNLVLDVLKEASDQIHPVVDKAWNQVVVNILIQKCSAPLGAVKGVAATYRMTNRPPPTQASPFVATILRPLKEFDQEFANRTPDRIGNKWKQQVVVTLADRYAAAVEDLIATVQRTEEALKNRKARRMAAGGMSDGEKVKLQLYLDFQAFTENVRNVGVEPATVIGLGKLGELTAEGEKLLKKRKENGA